MVKPKKHLGQHFLTDLNIAQKIVNSLNMDGIKDVLEIGPGTGVLTQFLLQKDVNLLVVEVDEESISYLQKRFPDLNEKIIQNDFLKTDLSFVFENEFAIIGNFPYNISNQILFKLLEYRRLIPEMCGMFQKEVAERIVSPPGSKVYGILSVFIQAYFTVDYLFTVNEHVFFPPPKVKSAVIHLKRKENYSLNCDEKLFFRVVKTAFNQRRKTIRNSLKSLTAGISCEDKIFSLRPEQLNSDEFVYLTRIISEASDQNG
jgi:16S rRNA (adenine1518-N6/adenine1519-N6)-dimethyltransferase